MGTGSASSYYSLGPRGPLTGPDGKQVGGTGRAVRIPWVSLYRMAGGRITEWHAYWDALGVWKQLGY